MFDPDIPEIYIEALFDAMIEPSLLGSILEPLPPV